MRKIVNPFIGRIGHDCFGCSPGNAIGMALDFFEDGDDVVTTWTPRHEYVGFEGVLHGGIQATAHDEIASWVVFVKAGTAGWTANLHVDYRAPVLIAKGPIMLRARLDCIDGNKVFIVSRLFDGEGTLGSEARAEFFTLPEHIARRRLAYPGRDAFFEIEQ